MRKSMAPAALFDLTLLPPLACLQHNPHSAISALQPYLPLIDTGVWLDPKGQQRSVSSFAFSVHDLAFRERASESLFSFAICAPAAMFPLLSTGVAAGISAFPRDISSPLLRCKTIFHATCNA
jgi:hypothetical protein